VPPEVTASETRQKTLSETTFEELLAMQRPKEEWV
jgi:hypothetical protein